MLSVKFRTEYLAMKEAYFKLAKEYCGTNGMIGDELRKLVKQMTRQMFTNDPHLKTRRKIIAELWKQIAEECLHQTTQEKWTNDYALDIADSIRQASLSVR